MIYFFDFSSGVYVLLTITLCLCVFVQTLVLVFQHYRYRFNDSIFSKKMLEACVLAEIFIFIYRYGQFIKGYTNGFVSVDKGESVRVIVFVGILWVSGLYSWKEKRYISLFLLPVLSISLPWVEKMVGSFYPWCFIGTVVFLLVRGIKICIESMMTIRTKISALSVKRAIDTLHTAVLFSEEDGYIVLSNKQMQTLMLNITGKIYRNAIEFYDSLFLQECEGVCKRKELEGQWVYILPDKSAWMFTKSELEYRNKKYIHISVSDITQLWELTEKLQIKDQELRNKSQELKRTIENLQILIQKKEIEKTRIRVHDILGQRLSVLLRIIQNNTIDYDLLTSLSRGLLAELKTEVEEGKIEEEIYSMQEIFATIGVNIHFEGQLPENRQKAKILLDIIREGATNAVRHGLATKIFIQIREQERDYVLTIKNNGYIKDSKIVPGNGITTMQKRVEKEGGSLDIFQQPLFTLSIVLPRGDSYV